MTNMHEFDYRPVFILAPPRSFTSIFCAMLGQHPQMYGLPELHLFMGWTVADWWIICSSSHIQDGLVRAIAEIFFGTQNEFTVGCARAWLRQRLDWNIGMVIAVLAQKLHPKIIVEKSPSTIVSLDFLNRAFTLFPKARFIHLTRHPIGQAESVMKLIQETAEFGQIPDWLLNLASYPYRARDRCSETALDIDPQGSWYELNRNICEFLRSVPTSQQIHIRGEDLLAEPNRLLTGISRWLGLRTDPAAIDAMNHPEHSPYACLGPLNALLGNDPDFLANPLFRPKQPKLYSLNGPLSWRRDGRRLFCEVKELARQFGYT